LSLPSGANVLIALPKGFGYARMFGAKISSLLSKIEVSHVTLIQDEKRIAERYFANVEIPFVHFGSINKGFGKSKLAEFSHIIVFWDGEDLTDIIFQAQLQKLAIRIVAVKITKVRNKDKEQPFDVYIGRGTPWGNPFAIGIGGVGDSRDDVIRKFNDYFAAEFLSNSEKHRALLSLQGYKLGCHCKPLACHGDIIADYLNSYEGAEDVPSNG
jgi:hypothetical protein